MRTKYISWKEYAGETKLPKLMTVQDMVYYHTNREAEIMHNEVKEWTPRKVELPNDIPQTAGMFNFMRCFLP